eukprot:TRINITY_DN1276_c0_g1_i1.p2 TRINITY_DN1276_c0_g1~~TRINITY_DN1276_c0_g1_i1.p2  ORF type:complete len:394 (+),score=127.77 TRINITY_DN1276_c0_g1_i1:46-1227(+)
MRKLAFLCAVFLLLVGTTFANEESEELSDNLALVDGELQEVDKELFDLEFAQEMFHLCGLCKCKVSALRNWTCPYCTPDYRAFKVYETNDKAATQFMVVGNEAANQIIAVYRGTELNVAQWLTNIFSNRVPFYSDVCRDPKTQSRCRVHSGFYKRWEPTIAHLVDALHHARQEMPNADIIITGHSAGGAYALLTAAYLHLFEPDLLPSKLYTFGAPLVGTVGFVNFFIPRFGENYVRVIRKNDPFPYIPRFPSRNKQLFRKVPFDNATNPEGFAEDGLYHHFGTLAVCHKEFKPCDIYTGNAPNPRYKHFPMHTKDHSEILGLNTREDYGPGNPSCGGRKKGIFHLVGLGKQWDAFRDKLDDASDKIRDTAENVGEKVKDFGEDAVDAITDLF